ncbi:MAG: BspA family leucine-rich repeat surface protein, partial [Bacteroidaceae bacterium]|nr:BspA family leucine-rich repeat surface protein [Bacteroidaceae bacterium]
EYLHTDNVTTFSSMFTNCSSLTSVGDLSTWDTSNVTSMYQMFLGCSSLTELDLSKWNTSNVTNMRYMFSSCRSLTELELSGWNTGNVTNTAYMFSSCSSLTELDLSKWNTANVKNMIYTFSGCSNLKTIYVGSGWSTTNVTSSTSMFANCTSLKGMNGTQCDGTNNIDKTYARVDARGIPGYLSSREEYAIFEAALGTLTHYYDGLMNQREAALEDHDEIFSGQSYQTGDYLFYELNHDEVIDVVYDPSVANFPYIHGGLWCSGLSNLNSVEGLEYLNAAGSTYFSSFFSDCSQLKSLDLSSWDISNARDMSYMFLNCTNLKTIYVGENWSTDAVTASTQMFKGCTGLVGGNGTTYNASYIDKTYARVDAEGTPGYLSYKAYVVYDSSTTTLTFYCDGKANEKTGTVYDLNDGMIYPAWYTDNTKASVTKVVFDASFAYARPNSTYNWFGGMTNLATINGIEYLNTSVVTRMTGMFTECSSLTSLDLTGFNTEEVVFMNHMFYGCTGLTTLDLSSFNTSRVNSILYMFYGCSALTTIYVGDNWDMTNAASNSGSMFGDCTSLVGGAGTSFASAGVTDAAYAHIDGGIANPGYFTAKTAYKKGDVNMDGEVNVSDVTMLVSMILGNTTMNTAADVNTDGEVNVSDVTALVSIILNN